MNLSRPIFSILLLVSVFSCEGVKKGALSPEVRTELDLLTERSDVSTETKYDTLGTRIAVLLEEAMAKPNNTAMVDHLLEFEEENALALQNLKDEFDQWFWRMDDEERMQFAMRYRSSTSPPFAAQLVRLIPQAKRRLRGNPRHYQILTRIIRNVEVQLR